MRGIENPNNTLGKILSAQKNRKSEWIGGCMGSETFPLKSNSFTAHLLCRNHLEYPRWTILFIAYKGT